MVSEYSAMPAGGPFAALFGGTSFTVRKKFLKVIGGVFHIYDAAGTEILQSRQKAFRLREDIRIFSAPDFQTEVLTIAARQMLDFAAAYDVVDTASGRKLGALRRKGLKSLFKDEWLILDANDRAVGHIKEDSALMAAVRRVISLWIPNFIPQSFHVLLGETPVARFHQDWNPFLGVMHLDFTADTVGALDRRLALAAAILLVAVEGQQN